jgi:hypothetical protein
MIEVDGAPWGPCILSAINTSSSLARNLLQHVELAGAHLREGPLPTGGRCLGLASKAAGAEAPWRPEGLPRRSAGEAKLSLWLRVKRRWRQRAVMASGWAAARAPYRSRTALQGSGGPPRRQQAALTAGQSTLHPRWPRLQAGGSGRSWGVGEAAAGGGGGTHGCQGSRRLRINTRASKGSVVGGLREPLAWGWRHSASCSIPQAPARPAERARVHPPYGQLGGAHAVSRRHITVCRHRLAHVWAGPIPEVLWAGPIFC